MSNALEIRGLKKLYPSFTLGPLDLSVPEGAIYGFVGPNGSGKSTTMDAVFGMGSTDSGTISVFGCDHRRDELAMKRLAAYVSPELNYQPWNRVYRAIAFVRGFYPTWDADYCQRLMDAFRLHPHESISALSFGAKTKLALVLALSWRPRLLVLDEPTIGLDAISRQQVFAELLSAVKDGDRTVFISSHAISDLERFADHVGMIKNGRLVFEGTITDVLDRYRIVDVTADGPIAFPDDGGVYVQHQAANRWRLLLDTRRASVATLRGRGVRQIADAPVSLEELFVALGRV